MDKDKTAYTLRGLRANFICDELFTDAESHKQVYRAEGLVWKSGPFHRKDPCLYVELTAGGVTYKTKTSRNKDTFIWDEDFAL